VRAKKITAVVFACVMSLDGAASLARADAHTPVAAAPRADPSGGTPSRAADSTAGAPAADESTGQSGDAPAQKKRGNFFVRALTAPFRAIGRFFSGGGEGSQAESAHAKPESKPVSAPKASGTEPQPTRAQTADAAGAAPAASNVADATDATYVPAPSLLAPVTAAPPAAAAQPQTVAMSKTPPAAGPTEAAAASLTSTPPRTLAGSSAPPAATAPFTPLIVGVPGDPLSQGRALLEHGYAMEAIRELSIAAVSGTNLVEANNLLGLAHDRLGRHAEARGYYERALSVAPGDARVINNLGYSLYLDDRYADALSKLKAAARLAPASPEIYNNLGFVYARLNKYGEALKNFARAGGDFYARTQTGALLEAGGRDLEAVKHYEAARRIDPARADVLRRLISLYTRTGQREKADAAKRSLERPKNKATTSTPG
jgi:Tfp pilus assembly protein PilF